MSSSAAPLLVCLERKSSFLGLVGRCLFCPHPRAFPCHEFFRHPISRYQGGRKRKPRSSLACCSPHPKAPGLSASSPPFRMFLHLFYITGLTERDWEQRVDSVLSRTRSIPVFHIFMFYILENT